MTVVTEPVVSDAAKKAFAEDGLAVVRGLLDQYWLGVLAEAAEEIRQTVKAGGVGFVAGETVVSENAWTFNDKLKRFAFESGVAQAAAEAMGSHEARLFETLTIYKEVGCDQGTAWHQDFPQHGMTGTQACSVWLSLEPVDKSIGGLRAARGSQRGPWYTPMTMPPGRENERVELDAGPVPDVDGDPERFPVVSYATRPGDIILLHPAVLHSTRANPSRARRRSFSIRFYGDDIRRKASPNEWHTWLKELPIKDGDPMVADCFPRVWPQ